MDDYLGTLATMSLDNMCVNAATHKRKHNEANYFRKSERINIPSENTVLKSKELRSRTGETVG